MIRRWIDQWIDALTRNEEWAVAVLFAGMIVLLALTLIASPD